MPWHGICAAVTEKPDPGEPGDTPVPLVNNGRSGYRRRWCVVNQSSPSAPIPPRGSGSGMLLARSLSRKFTKAYPTSLRWCAVRPTILLLSVGLRLDEAAAGRLADTKGDLSCRWVPCASQQDAHLAPPARGTDGRSVGFRGIRPPLWRDGEQARRGRLEGAWLRLTYPRRDLRRGRRRCLGVLQIVGEPA